MTTSEYIKLLKEKDKNISELERIIDNKEEHIDYLSDEIKSLNEYISYQGEIIESHEEEINQTVNEYEDRIDVLIKEFREHREAMQLEREENRKERERLNRRLEEQEFNANERFYKSQQNNDIKTSNLLSKIEGNTKNNLNRKVTNPTDETKKCFLRVTVDKNYKNLPENSFITLTVNRTQKRNLKPINNETEVILLEENVANSIELYNNFMDKSDINFIRTPTGININVTLINTFITELKKYIRNENSRGTSEVLTSEVGVTIENNLILYEDVLRREFYIDHRYRSIYLSESGEFYYNKINRLPTFITLENLIGCLCRINNEPSKRVKRIELIKGKYVVVA